MEAGNMRLQGALGSIIHCRPQADIDHTGMIPVRVNGPSRINAVGGELLVVGVEVGSGKSQLATELATPDDCAEYFKWPPETGGSGSKVARFHIGPDACTAHRDSSHVDGRDFHGLEVFLPANLPDEVDRSRATGSKTPTATHHDAAERVGTCGEMLKKFAAFHRSYPRIEGQHKHMTDTHPSDETELVSRGGQQPGSRSGPEKLRGMRIKSECHRSSAQTFGISQRTREHGLVPEMDTIEDPHRQHYGASHPCQRFDLPKNIHLNGP